MFNSFFLRTLLTAFAATLWLAATGAADDLVYTFKGVLPTGASSHSKVADGETFTAIFTIDPTIWDEEVGGDFGRYPGAVLSGKVIFSGGYTAEVDFSGGEVSIFNDAPFAGYDGIAVNQMYNRVAIFTDNLATLHSDQIVPAGWEFNSFPAAPSHSSTVLTITDDHGSIEYSADMANNLNFVSSSGIAWSSNVGFYDSAFNWINGFDSGPPAATDNALLYRAGDYELHWDSLVGTPTARNLLVRNGNPTLYNTDGGDYSLIATDQIQIKHDASLNLTGFADSSVGLDTTFLVVDGELNAYSQTEIEVTNAMDIGRNADGIVRLTGQDNQLFVGTSAMYIGAYNVGVLEIRDRAVVNDAGSPRIGADIGSSGYVLVNDIGSQWNMLGDLEIGNISGTAGNLSVRNWARVDVGRDLLISHDDTGSPFNDVDLRNGGQVRVANDLMLGGAGIAKIRMQDNPSLAVLGQIVIEDGSAIETFGSGIPDINASTIINRGLVFLDGEIGVDVHGQFVNQGEVHNVGSTLNYFFGPVWHDGTRFETDEESTVEFLGGYSGNGVLSGPGNIEFRSGVNPGFSTGTSATGVIFVEGNARFTGGANLTVEVAGTNFSHFDRVWVDGELELSGAQIQTTSLGGFSAQPGDEFKIMNVGVAATGIFDGLQQGDWVGTIGSTDMYINYFGGDGNDVFLTTVPDPFVIGDINSDGVVNLLDVQPFVELLTTGSFQREGDIRRDGQLDLLDVTPFVELLSGT